MKRFKLLTILLMSIIIFTGCSKTKKTITSNEFYETISKNGIVVSDVTQIYGSAEKAYQSQPNDNQYSILFIEGKSIGEIKDMFLDEGNNIYQKAGISDEAKTVEAGSLTTKAPNKNILSGKNWQSLEVTTESNYYYLIFVDNTLLYIESNLDNKDKLVKIKDTIHY